jgi:hypothetical protein
LRLTPRIAFLRQSVHTKHVRYSSRKVAAESSFEKAIEFFFNLPNPSSRIITLAFTQPLIKMGNRRSFWGKARPARKADNLIVICKPTVLRSWSLDVSQPHRDGFTFYRDVCRSVDIGIDKMRLALDRPSGVALAVVTLYVHDRTSGNDTKMQCKTCVGQHGY